MGVSLCKPCGLNLTFIFPLFVSVPVEEARGGDEQMSKESVWGFFELALVSIALGSEQSSEKGLM